MITLISEESEKIPIDATEIVISKFIKEIIEETDEEHEISLNFSSELIKKVIQFCTHYKIEPLILPGPETIETPDLNKLISPEWYIEYINLGPEDIFKLMNIANYLDIDPLIELTCIKIATLIKGKEPDQIRDEFKITDCLSEEEKIKFITDN